MRSICFSISVGLSALFLTGSAYAAVITNLGDKPQNIEIAVAGGYQPVVIAAGQTYRVPGKLDIRYQNHPLHIEDGEEYALWKNGDFGLQRHTSNNGGLSR